MRESREHFVFSAVYETACPVHGIKGSHGPCTCRGSWHECSDFASVIFRDGRVKARAVIAPNGYIHYPERCALAEGSPCAAGVVDALP